MRTGALGLWFSSLIGRTTEAETTSDWERIESRDKNILVNFKTNRHPSAVKFTPIFRAVSDLIDETMADFVEGKI